MADIRPFQGVRPADVLAGEVIAPPYDVLSEAEARAIVADNPRSFLKVTRSEVDLAEGADSHSAEAYAMARSNLEAFLSDGTMVQDSSEGFYLYTQTWQGRTQSGLMAACSVAEYDRGEIKRHELTRPDKEQDRVDHMMALDAHVGLVFLAYRDNLESVRAVMTELATLPAAWSVTTPDGVVHALTPVQGAALVERVQSAFAEVPALYIADGHHRSAAASRVCAARSGAGHSARFLAGIFPDSELRVLAYNRQVVDLNGHTPESLLTAIREHFEVTPSVAPVPEGRGHWTMFLDGQWFGLRARAGVVDEADPVASLDVAVLQDRVLGPLLGIGNPRTDPRIHFVGGIRGHEALESAVREGSAAVAFHLHPTGMDQLFGVADAGELMPPKSTWFEPKLRGGVVLHRI